MAGTFLRLFFLACTTSAVLDSITVKDSVDVLPPGWTHDGVAGPSDVLRLSFALHHDGMSALKRRLDAISDPTSPEYGRYLTQEETEAYRTPAAETIDTVLNWLATHGVGGATVEGDLVHVEMSGSQTVDLLGADLAYYSFEGGDAAAAAARVLRARSYTLPTEIASRVVFVSPLTNFMAPRQQRRNKVPSSRVVSQPQRRHMPTKEEKREKKEKKEKKEKRDDRPCSNGTTPACIRDLYNFHYRPESDCDSPARMAIGGFLEQYLNYDDLRWFLEEYEPSISKVGYNLTIELINGGNNSQTPEAAGQEASLDVQYAIALTHPIQVSFTSTGGRSVLVNSDGIPGLNESDNEPWMNFLQHLLSRPARELPHVVSLSYSDNEQSLPVSYARYVCDLFAALAARGVSVFVASGDGGSNGVRVDSCLSNDGLKRQIAVPTFPPSCPYVTAVGAVWDDEDGDTAGEIYSSGGFSNLFPRHGWQEDQAQQYMASLNVSGVFRGRYNASGRATPDLAALGTGFAIRAGGVTTKVSGTSASTVVVAAMFAAINDARLRAGMNVTGWLNPRLYDIDTRGLLEDVRKGESVGCRWGAESVIGWQAELGFDCVTGLGVPSNFEILLDAFLQY